MTDAIPSKIMITSMTSAHLEQAINCLCESFLTHEPLTSHLQVSDAEFRPFVRGLVNHCLSSYLSSVALDTRTWKVIGVRVATPLEHDYQPRLTSEQKMATIVNFLETVSAPLKKNSLLDSKRTIHSHMVAVDAHYAQLGIAKSLLHEGATTAIQLGFNTSLGEVTNRYNKKVLSRIKGWHPFHSVRYEDYQIGGSRPFAGIQEHEDCTAFVLNLREYIGNEDGK